MCAETSTLFGTTDQPSLQPLFGLASHPMIQGAINSMERRLSQSRKRKTCGGYWSSSRRSIVTLIYIRFAIAPITDVENLQAFALKIISTVVIANVVGLGIYVLRKRK